MHGPLVNWTQYAIIYISPATLLDKVVAVVSAVACRRRLSIFRVTGFPAFRPARYENTRRHNEKKRCDDATGCKGRFYQERKSCFGA